MNTQPHPSPEQLNAYHDRELEAEQRASITNHLESCHACRDEVTWFGTVSELGKAAEPAIPGDSYWLDLPDRILARIGERSVAASPARREWWSRLWNPQESWRYAVGASVSLLLVAGAWFGIAGTQNPWQPGGTDVAELQPGEPAAGAPPNSLFEEVNRTFEEPSAPAMTPESFSNRVMLTFGRNGNFGQSLDILPGRGTNPTHTSSASVTQVSNSIPPLGDRGLAAANGVVTFGCGENPIEEAFLAALKAEEAGEYELAAEGYQLIRSNLAPGQSLRHEAEFRLVRLMWESRVNNETAYHARAQAMADLNRMANHYFKSWEESKLSRDCQKAWCMNKVLLSVAPEIADPNQVQLTSARMSKLKNCVE